jgi:serine/threonine-protein kinase
LTKHLENLKKGAVTFGAGDRAAATAQAANELVFCGFCGQKIVASDMFCPFCGAQQPLLGQAGKGATAFVAPKVTARVMVIGTNDLDTPMFHLDKDNNLVGRRDPMSNIFPEIDLSKFDPQPKISRRHARIWRQSDTFMLEDLGSSNGTVLITKTNEPLRLPKNQPHVLANGDKIRLGDTMLHFMIG